MTVKIEAEGHSYDCLAQLDAQRVGTLNADLEITFLRDFVTRSLTGECTVRQQGKPDRIFTNLQDAGAYMLSMLDEADAQPKNAYRRPA